MSLCAGDGIDGRGISFNGLHCTSMTNADVFYVFLCCSNSHYSVDFVKSVDMQFSAIAWSRFKWRCMHTYFERVSSHRHSYLLIDNFVYNSHGGYLPCVCSSRNSTRMWVK